MKFFKDLSLFATEVSKDSRIPPRDKKVIIALAALIVSPIDLIPDWIPIIGVMDDFVMLALIIDYFFEVLDDEVLLAHFPWSMKSYLRVKRASRIISRFSPKPLKRLIWKYEGDLYNNKRLDQ